MIAHSVLCAPTRYGQRGTSFDDDFFRFGRPGRCPGMERPGLRSFLESFLGNVG